MVAQYLECGKIINTHGIDGVVKIESWCDSPAILAGLKKIYFRQSSEYEERKVLHSSVFKQFVIAKIEGIESMDAAEKSVSSVLYASRDDIALGDGDHFIADLIGLDVIDEENGHIYGRLKDVINTGASDIYVIDTPDGEKMMPAVKEYVKNIDIRRGIYIRPIEGMF